MPFWAVVHFFGACSTHTQLELPFWAIWFYCFFPQCLLCSVALFYLHPCPRWCACAVLVFCTFCVYYLGCLCCVSLLGLPAFTAAFGQFCYAITVLLCSPAFPVLVPLQYLLLPAPVLQFVLLVLLLAPVSELGCFCALACTYS